MTDTRHFRAPTWTTHSARSGARWHEAAQCARADAAEIVPHGPSQAAHALVARRASRSLFPQHLEETSGERRLWINDTAPREHAPRDGLRVRHDRLVDDCLVALAQHLAVRVETSDQQQPSRLSAHLQADE